MPGTARKRSETGVNHVILRGVNRRIIFPDREEKIMFLEKNGGCVKWI